MKSKKRSSAKSKNANKNYNNSSTNKSDIVSSHVKKNSSSHSYSTSANYPSPRQELPTITKKEVKVIPLTTKTATTPSLSSSSFHESRGRRTEGGKDDQPLLLLSSSTTTNTHKQENMEKDVNDPSNSGIRNVGGSISSNTQTSVKSSTDSQDVDSLYMNINSSGNFPSIVPDSKVPEKGEMGKESICTTGTSATINQANKEETEEKNHTSDVDEDTKIQEDSGGRSKIEGSYNNNKKINSEEDYVDDDHNNINFWQKPLNSWFDTYNEVSRNTARITEHWLKLFWNPWTATTENEINSSNKREKVNAGISRI
jgi:hypothetical protein